MIRALDERDVPLIASLAEAADAEGFRFLRRLLADATTRPSCLDGADEFYLAVVEDGAVIAVGGITPDPYTDDPDVGRVRHLYVVSPARRGGVGRTLVTALERRAAGRYRRLRLRTDTREAAAFYERIGYTRTSEPEATHARIVAR